nr:neurotrophin receptor-interacting factor homolog [Anolis sagrei ordinatus]
MATEKKTEFSTPGLFRVIVEPERRSQIKMEVQELESETDLQRIGEGVLSLLPKEMDPQRVTAAPKPCIKWKLIQGASSQQWPEILHAPHSLMSEHSSLQRPENYLREDGNNSLPQLEGVVSTRHWATSKITRLGKTMGETQSLNFGSGKEDSESPRVNSGGDDNRLSSESQRQYFRQFDYKDAEGPWEAYCQLRRFCHQWLKPEAHTKEEILELVILEQFLSILPREMLSWIRERDSESCFHAVALAEHFLLRQHQAERQVQQQQQVRVFLGES